MQWVLQGPARTIFAQRFMYEISLQVTRAFEFGGDHKLNSSALLNPKNIKLNKYGNMPRNKLSQLKAKSNVFIGDVNNVNAVWQRRKPKPAKKKRAKRSPNGTRRPKPKQRPPKLLVRFGDALPVTPVLGYMDRSKAMAEALMPAALSRAIADAIMTAK